MRLSVCQKDAALFFEGGGSGWNAITYDLCRSEVSLPRDLLFFISRVSTRAKVVYSVHLFEVGFFS